MKYSDYINDQIISPEYNEIAQELIKLVNDEKTLKKMERNFIFRWI